MNDIKLAAIQHVTASIQTWRKLYSNTGLILLVVVVYGSTVDRSGAMVSAYEKKSPSIIHTYITAAMVFRSDTRRLDTTEAAEFTVTGVRPDPGDKGALAGNNKLFPYTYDFTSIFTSISSDRTLQIIWEP